MLATLLAVAVGMGVYLVHSVSWHRQDELRQRWTECRNASLLADEAASAFVDRYVALFTGVARIPAVRSHDAAASGDYFRQLEQSFPEAENIAATGKDGCFFASAKPLSVPPQCISGKEFFQRVAKGAPLAVMQPHQGPITGEMVTGVVVPLTGDSGEFNGLVGASIHFSALSARWDELAASVKPSLVVYGQSGQVNYATGPFAGLLGKAVREQAPSLLEVDAKGDFPSVRFEGLEYLAGVLESRSSGLTILALMPRQVGVLGYFRDHPETPWMVSCIAILLAMAGYLQWKHRTWERALTTSEHRFRMILEHSPAGIGVYEAVSGRCVAANRTMADLMGGTLEELRRQNFRDLASWRNSGLLALSERVLSSGEPSRMDIGMTSNFGKEVMIDCLLARIEADSVLYLLLIIADISEKTRMQEIMVQTEKMMSLGGLAAGMAHEINNPLSGILQNAQVLANRLENDTPVNRAAAFESGCELETVWSYLRRRDAYALLRGIRDSAKRAAVTVSNMLEFSRKTSGEKTFTDLNGLLDRALELSLNDYDLKKKYDFRKVLVEKDYDTSLPPVPCTANQVEQVVLNLLKNAAQAMKCCTEGVAPSRLALRTRLDGEYVRIEVEDNGPGMPEDVRKRVFEPFFSTKPPGEGTGLGLSVSYYIITSNHKGTFEVVSKPGQGTTFIIRLPLGDDGSKTTTF
ncbi:ATP-binding protein [Fundidesulfovibrio terrae]|uniref:ATP-binding protein n=1 Tax=Fundidesulfovibrio terrae TaxID=2922866 RepID=UPI001FAE88BA|nr:ATP-binding protein [Fundidesulfovibrio terrae]